MDLSVWILICLMAICTSAEVESKPKSGRGKGSMWWGIAKVGEPNNIAPLHSKTVMYMDPAIHSTLRRKQRRLVREHPGVLAALVRGANMAISECQHQFRNRRWNCSTKNFQRGKNLFGKIVDRGCRETAFIYAITSAAVTHSVAKACSEGSIESCTCDYSHQFNHQAKNPKGSYWEWGGCSDNIGFGIKFARDFVDTGERGRNFREKMNLHNNEAGRMHVQSEMRKECKCHGMSGSCTVKTCWMRLPNFRVVGDNLKDRFDGATRIQVSNSLRSSGSGGENVINNNNHMSNMHMGGSASKKNLLASGNGNALQVSSNGLLGSSQAALAANAIHSNSVHHQRRNGGSGIGPSSAFKKNNRYNLQLKPYNPDHKVPESSDLVFLEPSPGFCERNPRLGIQGTHGRQCNDTSLGMDGCDLMCCGRGYRTQEITVVERCACMFHWCCEVKCKLCRTQKTIHTCL